MGRTRVPARSRCRAALALAVAGLAVPVALLAAVPPGASAADDPVDDGKGADAFTDDPWHAVDLPAWPATLVVQDDKASYHALTEAGTAVEEFGVRGSTSDVPDDILEMWADDEPYRKAGGEDGLAGVELMTLGDVVEDPQDPDDVDRSSPELAWIADDTLYLTQAQDQGFTPLASVAIEENAIAISMIESSPILNQQGFILVGYTDKIRAYFLDDGQLEENGSLGSPYLELPGEELLALYHRPVHDNYVDDDGRSGDSEAPAELFMFLTKRSGTGALTLYEGTYGQVATHAIVATGSDVPAGGWAGASLTYDTGNNRTLSHLVSLRGVNDVNYIYMGGWEIGPATKIDEDTACQGDTLASVDLKATGAGAAWACATVVKDADGGSLDKLKQWVNGVAIDPSGGTIPGGDDVLAPQVQIVSPCTYFLANTRRTNPVVKECSAGKSSGSGGGIGQPDRWSLGNVALNTYVSAGTPGNYKSYLVARGTGAKSGAVPAKFVVQAAPGTSARPALTVPLPNVRTSMMIQVDPSKSRIIHSDPVPIAFLAAPPQVAGAGQDADPPEFASTRGAGSSSGESTETSVEVGVGIAYEDPLGAFAASVHASVGNAVSTGTETSVEISSSEEFRGSLEHDVVVYNTLRFRRFYGSVAASSTGLGLYQPEDEEGKEIPVEVDLPLDGVTSTASIDYLKRKYAEFAEGGELAYLIDDYFPHTIGDPGSYESWDEDGAWVDSYCDGSLKSTGDRDFNLPDLRVPENDFTEGPPEIPDQPDILHSNAHEVLVGTGNSEGATFDIESSSTTSRVETWSFNVSAEARVAYVEASLDVGSSWSKEWTNTLSKGVGFASFVGHIPETNDFLEAESYDWRSFMCQKSVKPGNGESGIPVTAWVLNYTVDGYNGSGGLEDMSDIELTSPTASDLVTEARPDLAFTQETGTVHTYDWQLQAVNTNDRHIGQISFASPKASNATRQQDNVVNPDRDLLPGQLYRWRVKATDFFGNTVDSDWEFFRTPDVETAPQAVVTTPRTTVTAGETVVFHNQTSPGSFSPTYTWDFGDGTTITSSEPQVEHTFTEAGPVVVTLTSTTAAGTTTDEVHLTVLPKLASDQYRVDEDGVLDETTGVLDNDHGVTSVSLLRGTDRGTLQLNPDGTFRYTPQQDYCGPDAFTYSAGGVSAIATITVDCVNDAPKAVDDTYRVEEDDEATEDLLANDSDVDGDPLTLTAGPAANGSVTEEADGRFTYRPNPDWCGTDEFTTTVSDGNGGTDTARAKVNVRCVNDPPTANDDDVVLDEDTELTVDLLANDSDPDGDALILSVGPARHGTVTPGPGGQVTYEPEPDWCGTDRFVATVNDGRGGTASSIVNVTVVCINDGPVGSDDSVSVDENGTITINPVANDPDGDDLTVTVGDPEHGTVDRDDDGNLVYTPDAGFCGTDAIPVTFSDPDGESYTISVEVTVECVNDAPAAADDSFTTKEDTSLVLDPTVNDLDPDLVGELAVRFVGEPDHGDVRLTPAGKVRYTPARDFCGTDEFAYRPVDDKGLASDQPAMVTVKVRCVNDAPRAVRDSFARMVPDNGKVKVRARGILRNDVDPDSKIKAKLVRAPKRGVLKLRKNGGFTYRVKKNASPTSWVTFTYRACDQKTCSPKRKVTLHLR